jgi:hypothetical protein
MAIATTNQLNRLDLIEDTTSGMLHPGIVEAEQIAAIGQIRSLRHLSENSPIRASELTIAAMQSRINRAAGANSVGSTIRAENALRLFIQFVALSEEIRDNYAGTEASMSIEELYQQARQTQQQLFASFSNQIASSLANEMNTAFQRMEQNRGYEPGNQSQESGNQGLNPGNQGQGVDNQSKESGNQKQEPIQEPGGQEQEPGNQSPRPDNQSQVSDNQEQEPGSQEPSNQSPESSNQNQGSDNGDGNGSDGQQGK